MYKAIKEAIKEYIEVPSDNKTHSRLIVVLTNSIGNEHSRVSKDDVIILLKEFKVNLIVLGYDLDSVTAYEIGNLCSYTEEGRLITKPSLESIDEVFISL
jgi:hypothetical protein